MTNEEKYKVALEKISAAADKNPVQYPCDSDGVPISNGNSNDVLSDGIRYGEYCMAEIAREALKC